MSRGTDSIPAVLVTGSIVKSIIVSERDGPARSADQSPKSKPMIRMVTRLAPSQGGGNSTWGALTVGMVTPTLTGVPSAFVFVTGTVVCPAQVDGGIPARAVNRQHATKSREKRNNPTAATSPTPIQMNWPVVGRFKIRIFLGNSSKFLIVRIFSNSNGNRWLFYHAWWCNPWATH